MSKQRYEKEIEEILQKYDQEKGTNGKPREERPVPVGFRSAMPPARPTKPSRSMPDWKRFSSGQYIAMAFAVAVLAIFARTLLGPTIATLLVIVSAGLFILPIILYRTTGTTSGGYSPREEKRWRGQVIDFNTRRDITDSDPLAGIKRWLRRR